MKYHIITLGCQMNMSDSERTRPVIEGMGYTWTDDEKEATLLGIVACSVRQKAIDKVYSRIHKWNKWKNNKQLITFISGCILPSDKKKFLRLFDIVFHMSELSELPDLISSYGVSSPFSLQSFISNHENDFADLKQNAASLTLNEHIKDFWQVTPEYSASFEAFVPIQNGCDKFCTYCAVPYTRGREVSRSSDDILKEIQSLIDKNFKSITLLGQNVNSYGLDKKGSEISFSQLLERIGELGLKSKKEFWVYFTSPHPRDMTDDVIEVIAKYPNLAKQIHLPVQSGDNAVLKRMNRNHDLKKYRKTMNTIRRLIPQATVFTDIIVGFTGETDEEFENTRQVMNEFKFQMAYIAQYSPRPGARSSEWPDDIPKVTKKKRFHQLTNDLIVHASAYNKSLLGNTLKVLVRGMERNNKFLNGLNEGKINVRIYDNDKTLIGKIIDVKITEAVDFSVAGEVV